MDKRVRLVPEDARLLQLARRLGRPMRAVSYSTYDPQTDRDTALTEHCIATICRNAGLSGRVRLRPRLTVSQLEQQKAERWRGHIAFQSSSMNAVVPMRTKQWSTERMQTVVDHVAPQWPCIQIGSADDPPLRNVTDLRGKTSLRESAALLAGARLFVGLVGFLMHLARAVDCPAVIAYGGREPPELTGYTCNINVTCQPPCSPCWQRTRCGFDYACMRDLAPDAMINAVDEALARLRGPLAVEECVL